MSTVGLLHPGQMGAAVAGEIVRNGHTVLWCPEGRGAATQKRAEDAGLRPVADLPRLLEQCSVVLSICPPAAAEEIAHQVAETGYRGVFVDANAVSPATLRRIAATVSAAGGSFVDGSIIGAPPDERTTTRLYLAGESRYVRAVPRLVAGTRVEPVRLSERLGAASALKMSFASYQKASRVLAAVAHALADQHDVTEALLTEADRMPAQILADRDFLPSLASRAWRWAPEMREIAGTLDAAGLPADLAAATETVLARWSDKDDWQSVSPTAVLEHLRLDSQA